MYGQNGAQAPEPEIIQPGQPGYRHPVPPAPDYLPIFPEFTSLTRRVDTIARRIPWWVWIIAGFIGARWLRKRGGLVLPG